MLYWDATKQKKQNIPSGLNRVGTRLFEGFCQGNQRPIRLFWSRQKKRYQMLSGKSEVFWTAEDVLLCPELFCESERPFFLSWLRECPAYKVAIFHDAIPLRHPEFTWPNSVQRHPHYMKNLALFDLILTVSKQSKQELSTYWDWLNLSRRPPIRVFPSGADFFPEKPRNLLPSLSTEKKGILLIGIVEPRKNQTLLLEACQFLWKEGFPYPLYLVGRINPHFGKPILRQIKRAKKRGFPLHFFKKITDKELCSLYQKSALTVFPSLAEGNGLPILESLWMGVPTLCSTAVPAGREWAPSVPLINPYDARLLADTLKSYLTDPLAYQKLVSAVTSQKLYTWKESAEKIGKILLAEEKSSINT